ncbi:hypothetical protein IED13_15550 [Bosea sp. SSUT16]|uniref:Uncharacterized protein n=1 Tax=Bosea spartocytisi TaxID=2773451 RepID=A0A927I0B0_9HYPH|nr:hypothetical protein [Bosea spartocytisi]MBD3847124.1 hypothetical protein [Bosea spartocytisi]MCT4474180.1 hypothetical protein [Bosea spartocytisi]
MTVRAKFFVKSISHMGTPGSDPVAEIAMAPVFGSYGDGKVNETWSKYTPSGELKMTVTNPGAIEQFAVGKAYFLDFTPAD